MRYALFMSVAMATGVLVFFAAGLGIVAILHWIGGRDWTGHIGEDHWQTYICTLGAAGIAGLVMWPVSRFFQRRIMR